MEKINFNTNFVRYAIKNLASKGAVPVWGIVASYVTRPDVYLEIECGTLDQAKHQYNRVRENPKLIWKKVYIHMLAMEQDPKGCRQPEEPSSIKKSANF